MSDERQQQAIDQLRRAIKDEGPTPAHHRRIMAKHRAEWPTLWAAIDAILATTGEPTDG